MKRVMGVLKKYLGFFLLGVLAWQLLVGAAEVSAGIRRALTVCGSVLIPSLFPFMVLAALLPSTAAGQLAAYPFGMVARALYRASPRLAPALLMSWIGGYPAGARTVAELVDSGQITPGEAEHALCFCVNSGPAFMVSVVGAGVFGSPWLGMRLFLCQLAAGVVTAWLMPGSRNRTGFDAAPKQVCKPFSQALVTATVSAASAMISICAFVLLMGGLTARLESVGALEWLAAAVEGVTGGRLPRDAAVTLVSGIMEICIGCDLAAGLPPNRAMLVLPFLLSFSGISVICQVMSMVGGRGIPVKRFLLSRPVHGLITQLIAYPLLHREVAASAAWVSGAVTHGQQNSGVLATVLMLGSCAILCLTLEDDIG